MHFLFLNQYVPPDPSPTARLLGDLAEHLEESGHTVRMVSAAQEYHRPSSTRVGRYWRELTGLVRLLAGGFRGAHPDVVLSLSSPPCLLIPATLIARLRGARSVQWVMDLYPDIAVALGEIPQGTTAASLDGQMGRSYRRCALVVALDTDMAQRLARHGVVAKVLPPWSEVSLPSERVPLAQPWQWLYSGNLGRGHEWESLLRAQQLLEQRDVPVQLVFQGGGAARQKAQVLASELGLVRCSWRGYAPQDQIVENLLAAGAMIITQKPNVQGMLWPSKLATALQVPRPILWVGPANGAIAAALRERPGSGVFEPHEHAQIAAWVEQRWRNPQDVPASPGTRPAALAQWTDWLEALE